MKYLSIQEMLNYLTGKVEGVDGLNKKYFVYIDNDDRKMVYNKILDETHEYKGQIYSEDDLFIYYDNKHIVGTDIKQPTILKGLISINYNNKLTDLKGYPKNIGYGFYCNDNPIGSISNTMDIDFIRAFNIFKVIKGGRVNLKRLKYVMSLFNLPINLENIKKYYEIN